MNVGNYDIEYHPLEFLSGVGRIDSDNHLSTELVQESLKCAVIFRMIIDPEDSRASGCKISDIKAVSSAGFSAVLPAPRGKNFLKKSPTGPALTASATASVDAPSTYEDATCHAATMPFRPGTSLRVRQGRTRRGELCAHFLNLRRLFVHRCRETRNRCFQFLDFAVLFQKLVEQHRVYLVVTHASRLTFGVARH